MKKKTDNALIDKNADNKTSKYKKKKKIVCFMVEKIIFSGLRNTALFIFSLNNYSKLWLRDSRKKLSGVRKKLLHTENKIYTWQKDNR